MEVGNTSSRGKIFSTSRRDLWWLETLSSALVFSAVIIYSIMRAFEGKFFEWGPYLSPFYPVPFETGWISPAMLTMWVPAGYRITCYFCRRVYYRSLFADPPACAVREPKRVYKGESAFPYILLNIHRYFLLLAIIFVPIHWIHAIRSFIWDGKFGIGIGSLFLLADTVLLTLYVLSCHSLRHFVGGRLDVFSSKPKNYGVWRFISRLNEKHGVFFWLSLISVAIADLYIRLVASGKITDIKIF